MATTKKKKTTARKSAPKKRASRKTTLRKTTRKSAPKKRTSRKTTKKKESAVKKTLHLTETKTASVISYTTSKGEKHIIKLDKKGHPVSFVGKVAENRPLSLLYDLKKKAKSPGKRLSKRGRVYYEYRRNRSDQPNSLLGTKKKWGLSFGLCISV